MQVILKKETFINDDSSLLLPDLPFKGGEKVTVFIVIEADLTAKLKKWHSLFKETQNLPQCQKITEGDHYDSRKRLNDRRTANLN